ncbi:FliM/FliN family flagellar motor switch protein [Aquicoccus sp. SU-CL01552]|uniref:flagellar motor switch protein FliM n=1 Tax=Aquicoccus sp. SU-CL01552 TaxID=3127656 RepID=UPI003103A05F
MNKTLSHDNVEAQTGNLIDEIIKMSDFSFERLPMLDIIGERLAASISVALPQLTGVLCEATLSQLDYVPMGQAIDSLPKPAVMTVCSSPGLDGDVLLVVDSTLLLTAMELMLGGTPKGDTPRTPERFTAIERGFGRRIATLVMQGLRSNFSLAGGDIELKIERVVTDPDSATVTQPANLCVRMHFAVALASNTGVLEVILPYDALEPVRPKLGKIHFGEPADEASPWRDQLSGQIERATVELEAVLAEVHLSIRQIMNWKSGDTVNLWVEEEQDATVVCADTPMFRAAIGKRNNGNTAIRITEALEPEEETPNGRNDH